MKQIKSKKLPALVLALCLIISNAAMVLAGTTPAPATEPTITQVGQEITATAQYLKANVTLDAEADFCYTSKMLTLFLRSGIDCTSEVNSYLNTINAKYVSNGTLTLANPLTDYAYFAIVLALSGNDPLNYNGTNVISKMEAAITAADQTTLNSINPYNLPHIYTVLVAYSNKLTNSTACITKIKAAVLNYGNANGINYWGNSADNNGFGLSGMASESSVDPAFKTLADNAIAFSQTLFAANGASASDFTYSTLPNADSTAASMTLYSEYGYPALASSSYAGLLTFKTTATTGAYSYTSATDPASKYATTDALYGLLSYRAVLSGKTSPFNVSDTFVKAPVVVPEAPAATQQTTEAATETPVATDATTSDGAAAIDLTSPQTSDTSTSNVYVLGAIIAVLSLCAAYSLSFGSRSKKSKTAKKDK